MFCATNNRAYCTRKNKEKKTGDDGPFYSFEKALLADQVNGCESGLTYGSYTPRPLPKSGEKYQLTSDQEKELQATPRIEKPFNPDNTVLFDPVTDHYQRGKDIYHAHPRTQLFVRSFYEENIKNGTDTDEGILALQIGGWGGAGIFSDVCIKIDLIINQLADITKSHPDGISVVFADDREELVDMVRAFFVKNPQFIYPHTLSTYQGTVYPDRYGDIKPITKVATIQGKAESSAERAVRTAKEQAEFNALKQKIVAKKEAAEAKKAADRSAIPSPSAEKKGEGEKQKKDEITPVDHTTPVPEKKEEEEKRMGNLADPLAMLLEGAEKVVSEEDEGEEEAIQPPAKHEESLPSQLPQVGFPTDSRERKQTSSLFQQLTLFAKGSTPKLDGVAKGVVGGELALGVVIALSYLSALIDKEAANALDPLHDFLAGEDSVAMGAEAALAGLLCVAIAWLAFRRYAFSQQNLVNDNIAESAPVSSSPPSQLTS